MAGLTSATGFLTGAATGAVSGFTSGFVTGSGNSWMNGANFGDGLTSGLKSGGMGSLSGGLIGGITGGIDAWTKGTNFFTGIGKFNVDDGLAPSIIGFEPLALPDKTITGAYVGKYGGVKVYETSAFDGGIAIPERGIIVSRGAYAAKGLWGEALIQHEYGHILQYRMIGPTAYYGIVAPESLASATLHGIGGHNHSYSWMEQWANHLSHNYFGDRSLLSNYPTKFPMNDISFINRLRIRMYNMPFNPHHLLIKF